MHVVHVTCICTYMYMYIWEETLHAQDTRNQSITNMYILYKHDCRYDIVLLTKSYWVFDLGVYVAKFGWLAELVCVVVVAISWTKHNHVHVHCPLHKATSDSVLEIVEQFSIFVRVVVHITCVIQ